MGKEIEVLVTGGTGYMGSRLITMLLPRGHRVCALARQTSLGRVPEGAMPVVGDALDAASVAAVENPQPRGQIQIIDVAGIRSDGHDDSQSKSAGAEVGGDGFV